MDCKEEISDSDSGIMLHSGPDSPTSPLKEQGGPARALRLKQQALEEGLELCVQELRNLCLREAELTGKMPSDYPLLPHENVPQVRRRIGASFKLDKGFIQQDGEASELQSLEADLALHRQIHEASRRLSLEEHLSHPVRRSRLQQCKREERRVKELQEALLKHRESHGCFSPQTCRSAKLRDLSVSDDSSLSDVVALDDEVHVGPFSPVGLDSSSEEAFGSSASPRQSPGRGPKLTRSRSGPGYERTPIQNSPWMESSLDLPYHKPRKPLSASSSRSSSPSESPSDLGLGDIPPVPHFVFKSLALRGSQPNSAPSTPELPVRRQFSQSFRLPRNKPDFGAPSGSDPTRGRPKAQRRRAADFAAAFSPRRLYQSSSEDSSSEHSVHSHASPHASPPAREGTAESPKPRPPPYGHHLQHKAAVPQSAPRGGKNNNVPHPSAPLPHGNPQDGTPQEGEATQTHRGSLPQDRAATANQQPNGGAASPERVPKPPPPYPRPARAPSLRAYPTQGAGPLPRDVGSDGLKTSHQRNNLATLRHRSLERQGSFRVKRTANQEPPPYDRVWALKQGVQKVVLQRAPDGTPLQWYEEGDAQIVSQV